jgi:hypothetical protein
VQSAALSHALQEEFMLTEEGFKVRVAGLRKEEDALSRERERLEREKVSASTPHPRYAGCFCSSADR